jgi:ABC-type glycerol-3-phosphate transport system substrate-binding protein
MHSCCWMYASAFVMSDILLRFSCMDRYYRTASTYSGQIIGLPLVGVTYSLYYRRDILAAHGYTQAPATWDGGCWRDAA